MSAQLPTWFLLRDKTVLPHNLIELGRIKNDLRFLTESLNPGPLPPVQSDEPDPQRGIRKTIYRTASSKVDLLASFLAVVPLSGGMGGGFNTVDVETYHIKELKTRTFEPKPHWVDEQFQAPEVQDFLKNRRLLQHVVKPSLYMVSGVKEAFGVKLESLHSQHRDAHIKSDANFNAVGAPITVTMGVSGSGSNTEITSVDESMDFVYAFRLRKIQYHDGHATGTKPVKGEFYGVGDEDSEDADEDSQKDTGVSVQFWALGDVDAKDDFGLEVFDVTEDGEECKCAFIEHLL
jgi:hypothetical protein